MHRYRWLTYSLFIAVTILAVVLLVVQFGRRGGKESFEPVSAGPTLSQKASPAVKVNRSYEAVRDHVIKVSRNDDQVTCRVGQPIMVKGSVHMPEGYSLFEKTMFLEVLGKIRGKDLCYHSDQFPLKRVGDRDYEFAIGVSDAENLPKRPGRYRLKLTLIGFMTDDAEIEPSAGTGREVSNRLPFVIVPYEVVK